MITKQQAAGHQGPATIDTKELLALLSNAIRQYVRGAIGAGFKHPLSIAVRDSAGDTLRDFTIEASGQIVPGRTEDPGQLFTLPLTLFVVDRGGRIARCVIDVQKMISPTELVN